MKHNQYGFTLLEMLIVLSIVFTLSTATYFSLQSTYEKQVIHHFLKQFQEDIWLAQEYAISHSSYVDIMFLHSNNLYQLREKGFGKLIMSRAFHPRIKIQLLTMTNPITFTPNGNINRAGSLYVIFNDQRYKVIFLLGRGRFYIEKL
ncbi:competence type IV pilus minor pilin ComGD [Bacillus salitolerans]|uniref:Competence type IV pilus minor pilin ComGD n=1 Tax=Bacillus salitolerans TaxID=1437434 RepID=A0ABW4LPT0_9BACI